MDGRTSGTGLPAVLVGDWSAHAVHATVADIEQAIAHRKIVRTWPMRGTLHFICLATRTAVLCSQQNMHRKLSQETMACSSRQWSSQATSSALGSEDSRKTLLRYFFTPSLTLGPRMWVLWRQPDGIATFLRGREE
jgi:hypothetical protein